MAIDIDIDQAEGLYECDGCSSICEKPYLHRDPEGDPDHCVCCLCQIDAYKEHAPFALMDKLITSIEVCAFCAERQKQ